MDVVRADVNAMGGRIRRPPRPKAAGTSFKLVLPLTTAVTQVVLMRCAASAVAVPSALIEIVRRLPSGQLQALYERGTHPAWRRRTAVLLAGLAAAQGAPVRHPGAPCRWW